MSSQEQRHPPGIGSFRPGDDDRFDPTNHLDGWNRAVQDALDNFGRAPGQYHAQVVLSATVEVRNPGYVIEYIAKFS